MEQGTYERRSVGEDLARLADELLEHTRMLRTHYEELVYALDRVAPAPGPASDRPGKAEPEAEAENGDYRPVPDSLHAMALHMALAGETRGAVKEQLHEFEVEGVDEIVDEVFDRIEPRRSEGQRRRLLGRRAH
jgi:hypothetical protein